MAEIWGAALVAAGTAYSASEQKGAAKDAARASQNATDASIAEQRRQYDQTRADMMPWLDTGGWALGEQRAFLNGDMSGFEDSAGYQFMRDQGIKVRDRSAAARGGLLSGGHSADLLQFGQGLAAQHADSYWNKLAGLSNTGQVTGSGLASLGANMANNIGNLNMANADAQRQSAYQRGNANSQLAGGLAGLATGVANNWGSYGSQPSTNFGNNTGWLSGGMTPQTGGWQTGTMGPSNGVSWNFGGG